MLDHVHIRLMRYERINLNLRFGKKLFDELRDVHRHKLEDAESIQVKLNVMKANEIGGVAVWRLGYEEPSIWNLISSYSEN